MKNKGHVIRFPNLGETFESELAPDVPATPPPTFSGLSPTTGIFSFRCRAARW